MNLQIAEIAEHETESKESAENCQSRREAHPVDMNFVINLQIAKPTEHETQGKEFAENCQDHSKNCQESAKIFAKNKC